MVDLTVSGTVLSSNGNELKLEVRAVDSRGKIWLDKRYEGKAEVGVYLGREGTGDPFQEVYDRIAKDLLSKRQKLDEEGLQRSRQRRDRSARLHCR